MPGELRMRRADREVTDINEIMEILDQCKTAHVAMVDDGHPYVVPLSYGYKIEDGILTLYLHSAKEGRKIDILKKNPEVCFEICNEGMAVFPETPCNSGYYFSSVIGNGVVEFLEEAADKTEALSMMFRQQSGRDVTFTEQQALAVCVFKIVSNDFTGKRKKCPKDGA
ncbi:MAG: pyridoxamine 5'-phosphate oxidase family protein [Clostridia bacterium]|nr:pyridoxamine 5'-phosphate oxidase family protein [Clostridia bacterium]